MRLALTLKSSNLLPTLRPLVFFAGAAAGIYKHRKSAFSFLAALPSRSSCVVDRKGTASIRTTMRFARRNSSPAMNLRNPFLHSLAVFDLHAIRAFSRAIIHDERATRIRCSPNVDIVELSPQDSTYHAAARCEGHTCKR